jgi:hypothetical protein
MDSFGPRRLRNRDYRHNARRVNTLPPNENPGLATLPRGRHRPIPDQSKTSLNCRVTSSISAMPSMLNRLPCFSKYAIRGAV